MLIIAAAAVNDDRDHDWYMFPLIGTDSRNMYAFGAILGNPLAETMMLYYGMYFRINRQGIGCVV